MKPKTKACSKCKEEKPLSEFYRDKRTKDGLYSACRKCCYKNKKEYFREYRKTPKWKKYLKEYIKTPKWREFRNRRDRKMYQNNVKLRLNRSIGCLIWLSLKEKKAGKSWKKFVDYTLEELMEHLGAQFDDEMNWENYGSYWSIDHIKPRCLFSYTSLEDREFKECWALNNLQPLERNANSKKFNRFPQLVEK